MDKQSCQKFISNMGHDFIAIATLFLEWLWCGRWLGVVNQQMVIACTNDDYIYHWATIRYWKFFRMEKYHDISLMNKRAYLGEKKSSRWTFYYPVDFGPVEYRNDLNTWNCGVSNVDNSIPVQIRINPLNRHTLDFVSVLLSLFFAQVGHIPDSKDLRIDIDWISIPCESVGSMSDQCRSDGICCLSIWLSSSLSLLLSHSLSLSAPTTTPTPVPTLAHPHLRPLSVFFLNISSRSASVFCLWPPASYNLWHVCLFQYFVCVSLCLCYSLSWNPRPVPR